MNEQLRQHWIDQLEYAEKLRDNAIRELSRLALLRQVQLPLDEVEEDYQI